MEALSRKRERLRHELQEAYEAWLTTSEDTTGARCAIDVSGCPSESRAEWFGYLAAKERLILAYAEQPVTA
jgi:hypothetical protein